MDVKRNPKEPLLIGAIQLPAFVNNLLGSSYDEIEAFVIENALAFEKGGFDAIYIQDNTPGKEVTFQTIAWTSAIARSVRNAVRKIGLGIIIESGDPKATFAIASASNAEFVRLKHYVGVMVKAGGLVEGCAGEALQTRSSYNMDIKILADIYDREGSPLGDTPIEVAAGQAVTYGADGLVLTGRNFEKSLDYLKKVRLALPEIPLFIGGSVTEQNIMRALEYANGAVVSSSLQKDSGPGWDVDKIRSLVDVVNG